MTEFRKTYLLKKAIDYLQENDELADFLKDIGEVFDKEELEYFAISKRNGKILEERGLIESYY